MDPKQSCNGFPGLLTVRAHDIICRMSLSSLLANQLRAQLTPWLEPPEDFCQALAAAAELICHHLSADGRLLLSAPVGLHEAAVLTVKRLLAQGPIPLAALAVPPIETLELEPHAARADGHPWLQAMARPADVLVLLTPSGFSSWQQQQVEAAQSAQIQCVLLSPIPPRGDEALYIPIPSASTRIGVAELLLASHLLCDAIDAQLIGEFE